MPSRSKIGTSSSIDRKNARSDSSAFSGRPENSVLITLTPRSTVIWMTRFQLRTAASRASSSGPDQRSTGSTDAMPTPGVGARLAELRDQVVVGTRMVEERDEVPVRGQLQVLVAQLGHQRAGIRAARSRGGTASDPVRSSCQAPGIDARSTILTSTGRPLLQRLDAGLAHRGGGVTVPGGRVRR